MPNYLYDPDAERGLTVEPYFDRERPDSIISYNAADENFDAESLFADDASSNYSVARSRRSSGPFARSTATQAAKAIAAAGDDDPSWLSSLATEPAAGASAFVEEHEMILDAGPAPPDYPAATAWRQVHPTNPYSHSTSSGRGMGFPERFSEDYADRPNTERSLEERHRLLDPEEVVESSAVMICCGRLIFDGRRKYRSRRRWHFIIWGIICGVLLFLLVFVVQDFKDEVRRSKSSLSNQAKE